MSGVALVTGGQQGIGLEIARQLSAAGFRVAIASLPPPDDPGVRSALARIGGNPRYFQHDVSDVEGIPAVLDAIGAEMGPVATLVSNAGIGAPVRGDLLDVVPENWDIVQNVNLRGMFFLAQGVARRMLECPSDAYRSMIFITSVSAAMVSVERGEYCVSKAGAAMVAQLFAARLADRDIGVFDLRPGIIASAMTEGVSDTYTPRIEGGLVPARRWGQPKDIGEVVVSLATGQMRFATGATIPVDGGLSIQRL